MNKVFVCLVALTLVAISALMMENQRFDAQQEQASTAAFRDGAYRGQLAATRREEPRFATTRWASAPDQAAFAAGYDQSYRHVVAARMTDTAAPDAAYRDGLYLGKLQAEEGRSARTATSRWSSEKDRSSYAKGYTEAYGQASASAARANESAPETVEVTPQDHP